MSDESRQQIEHWCRSGDQLAFRAFYRAQAARLWKFLVARGCERETAYDIMAEAFLRLTQTVCRDPRAPVALLYRIALNLRVDIARREHASPVQTMTDPPEPSLLAESDDHAEVRALVASLPESEQNLLLLRYWIGFSHDEVAAALDLPAGTVRRQCAELLERLRTRLEDHA